MKKFFVVILAVVLLAGSLPAFAEAAPYEGVKLTLLERDCAVLPFDSDSEPLKAIQEATGIELELMLVADTDWNSKVGYIARSQ